MEPLKIKDRILAKLPFPIHNVDIDVMRDFDATIHLQYLLMNELYDRFYGVYLT